MKELSIEEKAKRYDEAIKRLEDIRTGRSQKTFLFTEGLFEYIFPELTDSEDGKIRKVLLDYFENELKKLGNEEWDGCIHTTDVIAWLEKQCKSRQVGRLQLSEELYEHIRNTCACIDDALSSETLADIKDYLSMAEHSAQSAFDMIENKGEQKPAGNIEPKFKIDDWVVTDMNNIVQIKAVNNGYYTLDNGMDFNMSYVDRCWHLWTIQDAKAGDVLFTGKKNIFIFESIRGYTVYDYCGLYFGRFVESPTSVNGIYAIQFPKDYVPATKEQRDILFQKMHDKGYEWDAEKLELKKVEQKPWSEEDDRILYNVITYVGFAAGQKGVREDALKEANSWLKNIKDRVQPQPRQEYDDMAYEMSRAVLYDKLKDSLHPKWKPSEEQMKCLDNVKGSDDHNGYVLNTLYNDLKKLIEE